METSNIPGSETRSLFASHFEQEPVAVETRPQGRHFERGGRFRPMTSAKTEKSAHAAHLVIGLLVLHIDQPLFQLTFRNQNEEI